jgi:IS5 family transposase
VPRQVSTDGDFASRKNLAFAKGREVKDAVFAKKRGLTVIEMVKSAWIYKMLRNFRAGIEAGISTLKRAFGLDRCTWSGWGGFKQYVWSSISSPIICWCWPESGWLKPDSITRPAETVLSKGGSAS